MAKLCLPLLLIILSIFSLSSTVEPAFSGRHTARQSRARENIEATCRTTLYRDLCIHCLSTYVKPGNMTIESPQELAQVALTASLYRALYARRFVLNVVKQINTLKRENQVFRDCLQQINDSVDQLSGSIRELRRLENKPVGDDLFWHIRNVETWTGTALTDANTCVEALPGPRMSKLKATIKGKMLNVAQTTSNALALFHRFATRYRAAASATKKP